MLRPLLHGAVRLLRERGIEPHIFYANSNIHPDAEYAHRLDTIKEWSAREKLDFVEGAYAPSRWEETAGRIGDAARKRFGVIAGDVLDERALGAGDFGHGKTPSRRAARAAALAIASGSRKPRAMPQTRDSTRSAPRSR